MIEFLNWWSQDYLHGFIGLMLLIGGALLIENAFGNLCRVLSNRRK